MRLCGSLIVALLCAVSPLAAGKTPPRPRGRPAAIRWQTDFRQASQQARRSKQPVLIDFYADWCGPCRLMEETTFRDPGLVQVLRQMACVRVDVDSRSPLVAQYHVSSIPRLLVLDTKGKVVVDNSGYLDAEALLEMLRSASSELGGLKFPEIGSPGASTQATRKQAPALLLELGDPRPEVRERASQLVRVQGAKAVPQLLDGLDHQLLAVRIGAYRALTDVVHPPSPVRYDPWAPRNERRKAAQALRLWWQEQAAR